MRESSGAEEEGNPRTTQAPNFWSLDVARLGKSSAPAGKALPKERLILEMPDCPPRRQPAEATSLPAKVAYLAIREGQGA